MAGISRREAIATASIGAAGLALAPSAASGQATAPVPAFAGNHQPKPLRFDPARLTGLSEKLITSHWQNNYQGSVRALNMVEQRLAAAMADTDFPAVIYGGLKREELHRTGSVILHELYFDGLGGDGKPSGSVAQALAAAFGSIEAWEAEFRRTAMSLAGGSGWCVLSYNQSTGSLHNYWAWDHMHSAVTGAPLIALDMYEHSYHMDYGTAAAKYVDAFLANLDWEIVDARLAAAR
ncbi:superoxide dismutase [Altererythrobacter salegens]|uniref:superoxide dismutase n=1 Tax=Croceibacterium salegens TaxID=1737568 RepID=A0A6I4SYW3_9SPHN|nr:Fe-Mn family superoxide dismutase [Croceibacterium salegens]MXO61245.1 superoxide dismutase [Croceibacterium salegens]